MQEAYEALMREVFEELEHENAWDRDFTANRHDAHALGAKQPKAEATLRLVLELGDVDLTRAIIGAPGKIVLHAWESRSRTSCAAWPPALGSHRTG